MAHASSSASSSYASITARFPGLSHLDPLKWELFFAVGVVYIALDSLKHLKASTDSKERAFEVIFDSLEELHSLAPQALEVCMSTVQSEFHRLKTANHDATFLAPDSLGIFIVTSTLGHSSFSDAEASLVRLAGALAIQAAQSWWEV